MVALQSFLWQLYTLLGFTLDPDKDGPMASQRHFLGLLLDLARALSDTSMMIHLKEGLAESLLSDIGSILSSNRCTPAEAAKLRGKLGWASCAMYGRCGRGGQAALVQRQYHDDDHELSPDLVRSLEFFSALLHVVKPRTLLLGPHQPPPVVIYTDASWEPEDMEKPGLGYVLLHPDRDKTYGGTASVQPETLHAFLPRETQILPLEALAVLQAFVFFTDRNLHGRDVLLFVDNQAVCSSLAKGASSASDVGLLCTVTHLLWAHLSMRVWVEWVASDDNPADGLSRAGVHDGWTKSQGWACMTNPCLPWSEKSRLPLLSIPDELLHWRRSLE